MQDLGWLFFFCHSLMVCSETGSLHGHKMAATVPDIISKHKNGQMIKIGHPTLHGFKKKKKIREVNLSPYPP